MPTAALDASQASVTAQDQTVVPPAALSQLMTLAVEPVE
jgi:hypothetical protein